MADRALALALATSANLPDLDPDSRLLLPAFAERGIDAQPRVWTDPDVDWTAYDAVAIRSIWDYTERLDEFLAWVRRVGAARPLVNPPDVVAWNARKTYLREFGERGVPVVDTVWLPAGARAAVPFDEAIVKPVVAAGARGLRRARGGEEVVAEADTMIQPLLRSIADEGELSLVYAENELTHAVRKAPAPGDVRSQPEYGAAVTAERPTAEMRETGDRVLAAVGRVLPYARVDLVRADDGTLRLIELEVIEPSLFLGWDERAAGRFVSALAAAARSA